MKTYKKIVLLILDGFGVAPRSRGNAIAFANPQHLNDLLATYPAATLQASGPLVGLPWGEMGNSEVGHLNMGAGRIVAQDLPRITASIESGDFFKVPAFVHACEHVKKNKSKLHLLGMVSTGGVHSYDEHLYALLALAADQGIADTFIHMITDGRDTDEKAALRSLEKLNQKIAEIGVGKIATVAGRFYAMDRGGHWAQTEMEYQAMVNGVGDVASSALACIAESYSHNIFDEMIKPTVIVENGQPVAKVSAGDAVIFFNFRQDRALQLTLAFVMPERMALPDPHDKLPDLCFVTMTSYMDKISVDVAFGPTLLNDDLASVVSAAGMGQYHAAESEKFAHVTSFFNGGKMDPLPGEQRMFVQSPDNANNYADHPEMSVAALTDGLLEKIKDPAINFYVVNFANGDMVGHTGNLAAATAGVKAMDEQIGRIAAAVLAAGGVLIITADHGNCENMVDPDTGNINKDHTTAPVPFILVAQELARAKPDHLLDYPNLASIMPEGALSDVAPTILELFGLPKPAAMTGQSLVAGLEQAGDPA
jgi:2,3-bisphosphoglycerate-independent phosphoglycerate mutase